MPTVNVETGKEFTVTDAGTTVDFGKLVSRVFLRSDPDNTDLVAFEYDDVTLISGAAFANEAALKAARPYLAPGDYRDRGELSTRYTYLRCAPGKTAVVKITR